MYDKLRQQVLPQLIPPGSRILAAVSGGPDSMALAHILWRYMKEMLDQEISLVLTHVHHGVRKESDEEEEMVKKVARDWEIPCLIHHFNSKSYAKSVRQSFQAAAREWRYARWQEDMQEEKCNLLATAHHLGDQAETVLYRLLRGSGTAGLAGIYPQKGKIIRPFLTVTKEEILEYCRKEELPYALDCSNAEPIYVRNKIRLELLPELQREYNPKVMEALGRMAELMRWDEEYLEGEVERAWQENAMLIDEQRVGLSTEVFQLPKAILSRLIRKATATVSGEPRGISYHYVDQIMASQGQVGWSQDLPGLKVAIDYGGIWFQKVNLGHEQVLSQAELLKGSLQDKRKVNWGEWLTWQDAQGQKWQIGLFVDEGGLDDLGYLSGEYVDKVIFDRGEMENCKEDLCWRHRQEGDGMWFAGLGHKSLKKVFQDAKVPAALRQDLPLLALNEEVLWIPSVKRGDRYRAKLNNDDKEKIIGILKKFSLS